jgi:hypothetical protein
VDTKESWVNRVYRRGLSMLPSGAPVLRIIIIIIIYAI